MDANRTRLKTLVGIVCVGLLLAACSSTTGSTRAPKKTKPVVTTSSTTIATTTTLAPTTTTAPTKTTSAYVPPPAPAPTTTAVPSPAQLVYSPDNGSPTLYLAPGQVQQATVTITNVGGTAVTVGYGYDPPDTGMSLVSANCPNTFQPGQSCQVVFQGTGTDVGSEHLVFFPMKSSLGVQSPSLIVWTVAG